MFRRKNTLGHIRFLERRLQLLEERVGFDTLEDQRMRSVRAEIAAGRSVVAAKRYQEAFGAPMNECVFAVAWLGAHAAAHAKAG